MLFFKKENKKSNFGEEIAVKYLKKKGYKAQGVWPFDMFPFCAHVETVCLLSRS